MATTEELLAQLENNPEMYAEESQELVIDAETRTINIPESETLFGVKGDKNIERKYFRCPRIVGDNVDLSTHLIYIAYVYTESNSGSIFPSIGIQPYHCDDVEIDGDNITFSWQLSDHVFQSAGFIAFKMYAKEKEDSPYTVFNTAPAIGTVLYTIGDGVESVVSEHPDIINQLLAEMESVQEIATPEAMQRYVNDYLEENPIEGGMTEEQEQQLEQNTTDVADLKSAMPKVDSTLSNTGEAADAKVTGDAINSLSNEMKNFLVPDYYIDNNGIYEGNKYHWAVSNTGSKLFHNSNKNWNFIGEKSGYKISAVSAYINYIWTVEDPTTITDASTLTVIESGGTYMGFTYYSSTDALAPEQHEVITEKPEDANYLLVDFGYTEPENTDFKYFTERNSYHVKEDGVWTESIKNESVTEEKLKTGAVTEEKIADEAVGKEKIKSGAIDVNALDISYTKIYIEPYVVAEGLEFYNNGVRSYTGEIQSNIYCIEMKAGKKYMIISEDYPRDENVTADRTQGKNLVNTRFGLSSIKISDWKAGDDLSARCDLGSGAYLYSALRSQYNKGNVVGNDVLANSGTNYYPSMFSPTKDIYLYFASYVPVGDQYLVTVPTGSYFLEVEEIPDFDEETDYVSTNNNSFLEPFKFIRNYTDYYTSDKIKNNYLVTNVFASKRNRMLEMALFRASRNISEYSVCAYIIGDSITYASSNAGLQNAWRKYITSKINIYQSSVAVSGTTMTYGYGTDWSSAINGASSGIEFTGIRGIKTAIKTASKGSSKQQHAFTLGMMEFAIVALGTNDFGNNAKLGSVETFDDDGTFYGATYQLFHFLHDEMKIPYVIFVAPFKRENWNVKNEAEVPYTIYDLVHALAEISLLENDMYVLDCTDRWYLNYDDPTIRAKSFIDYVHITGYAHHMFTIDLAIFIQNIVAVRGLRHYQPKFIGTSE